MLVQYQAMLATC